MKRNRLLLTSIILFTFQLSGFSQDTSYAHWADSLLSQLSLDEKIGQLLMVRTYSNKGPEHYKTIEKYISENKIGGLCFFQGGPVMQKKLTDKYQSISKVPLFIGIDAEWGPGMRLDSTHSYPFQMTMGSIEDNNVIYEMGIANGLQLKDMGVHINFAPVVDINNNPANPVINSRSFGENKVKVADKAEQYMMGLQDAGIIATAKHFPGHGDTDSDSHYSLPVINHSYDRIDSVELFPFKQLINRGLQAVMVAHLFIPSLDSTPDLPTTLSRKVVNGLLKDSLNFDGLVITDALDMKGVTLHYKPGEIEAKAFMAGNDILLLPQDVGKAIEGLKKAVYDGLIPEQQINSTVRKILTYKAKSIFSNFQNTAIDDKEIAEGEFRDELIDRKIFESAITLVQDSNALLPIKSADTLQIATLAIGSAEITPFQQMLSNYYETTDFNIGSGYSQKQLNEIFKKLENYNLIFASVHNTNIFPSRNFGIKQSHIEFLAELANKNAVVFTLFASPYSLKFIEENNRFSSIIIGHQDNKISNELCAQMIAGARAFKGILPVSSGTAFPAGSGIKTTEIGKLKYSIPEEVGIDRNSLNEIDTIVFENINEKAMPGCQILIAKNGTVIYEKSFGYHTYRKGTFVENTDIYDLASITKIAATTLAVMKLYDERKLDIDRKISDYLPYLHETNKENLVIRDIMTHQARLKPWIPFYLNTMEDGKFIPGIFSKKIDENHPVKVADNLFIKSNYQHVLFDSIVSSDLRKKKDYKYSDLGFYLLFNAIENLTNESLDQYVDENFYKPLGLHHTGFLPLKKFPKKDIVPTENDRYFRKQLIQGYVHDPGAAMLGGVSGHAGLFSTAGELAVIMQMLLQEGYYGGKQYIRSSTVRQFTRQQFPLNDNRRGVGFDKPNPKDWDLGPTCEDASLESFGHTGFTGTYAWADPEFNLVYIFLSNRVNPDANNVKLIRNNTRTDIQQIIYDAIPDKEKEEKQLNETAAIKVNGKN